MKKKGLALLLSVFVFCFLKAETSRDSMCAALFNQGKEYFLLGDYDKAITDFSKPARSTI
jgi:hypothetical protein